jgi:hypothetical protein
MLCVRHLAIMAPGLLECLPEDRRTKGNEHCRVKQDAGCW